MKPKVIHIRNAPKGWTLDPNYVYIGRPRVIEGKEFTGKWGNLHPVGFRCPRCSTPDKEVIHQRGEAVVAFEVTLRSQLRWIDGLVHDIMNLKGKTLVCFCHPNPCHGDILATVCEELNKEEN